MNCLRYDILVVRTRFRLLLAGWLLLPGFWLITPGCGPRDSDDWFSRTFRSTPGQDLKAALEAPSPDQRRLAILRIAKRGGRPSDIVFDVLSTAARTDPNAVVRCTAIRTLDQFMEERAVDPLIKILLHEKHADKVVAPPIKVRWDTIVVIDHAASQGLIPPDQKDPVRVELVRTLLSQTDRNIRIAAAQALASFPHRDTLEALIGALREEDFGIASSAEASLVALTGVTHQYEADAWLAWLKSTDNPFADAGRIPPGYSQRQSNGWRQSWKATKEFFSWSE